MGTTLHSTTAYNPAANGIVERAHHSLNAALMARCTDERWKEQLPWVLLGLRTAPKANDDASPAEKLYGETLADPREFFLLTALTPSSQDYCAYVFIRVDAHCPPLTRPYRGPHRVIRLAAKAYLLDIHGREDWVTINRLKPTFLLDNEVCEEAGRRPRVPPSVPPCRHTCRPNPHQRGTHRANPRCWFQPTPIVLQE
ncbi:uncharacterized protein [Macrobrachium rosenbergii]|uniref:uncharacterized protein n=1 Tax=Macrobrachium rosenbergii TaxID=79674 RepID=UPI0034D64503